jgi:hypothetical protein
MPRLRFEQLLNLYRHVVFDAAGEEGALTIATPALLADLNFIETDEQAGQDANMAVLVDPATLAVGQTVRVRVGAPRLGLGLLVRSFDDLLRASEARIGEPAAFFVVDGAIEPTTVPAPPTVLAYRKVLHLIALFAEAASYLDRTRQELVFFHDRKVVVPIRYDSTVLARVSGTAIDSLLENFKDDVHKDQKLAILAEAIVHAAEPQPLAQRLVYLLDNLDALTEALRNGYRLFASSFSYAKIRGEIETAKVEYVGKIHKTLIDIQSQLLGIPVATIIVASQLKAAKGCGVEFWTNIAVLGGAWIFLVLLLVAIVNQWVTLGAIAEDIASQQARLARDYAPISGQFTAVFKGLRTRIDWHRGALIGIGLVALIGAAFATYAYSRLTTTPLTVCLAPTPTTLLPPKTATAPPQVKKPPLQLPPGVPPSR